MYSFPSHVQLQVTQRQAHYVHGEVRDLCEGAAIMRERCTHVVDVYFGDDLCWTLAVLTSLLLPRCVLKLMFITIAPAADI